MKIAPMAPPPGSDEIPMKIAPMGPPPRRNSNEDCTDGASACGEIPMKIAPMAPPPGSDEIPMKITPAQNATKTTTRKKKKKKRQPEAQLNHPTQMLVEARVQARIVHRTL